MAPSLPWDPLGWAATIILTTRAEATAPRRSPFVARPHSDLSAIQIITTELRRPSIHKARPYLAARIDFHCNLRGCRRFREVASTCRWKPTTTAGAFYSVTTGCWTAARKPSLQRRGHESHLLRHLRFAATSMTSSMVTAACRPWADMALPSASSVVSHLCCPNRGVNSQLHHLFPRGSRSQRAVLAAQPTPLEAAGRRVARRPLRSRRLQRTHRLAVPRSWRGCSRVSRPQPCRTQRCIGGTLVASQPPQVAPHGFTSNRRSTRTPPLRPPWARRILRGGGTAPAAATSSCGSLC